MTEVTRSMETSAKETHTRLRILNNGELVGGFQTFSEDMGEYVVLTHRLSNGISYSRGLHAKAPWTAVSTRLGEFRMGNGGAADEFRVIRDILLNLGSNLGARNYLGFWKDIPSSDLYLLRNWSFVFDDDLALDKAFLANCELFEKGQDLFEEIYIREIDQGHYYLGSYQDETAKFPPVDRYRLHSHFIPKNSLVVYANRVMIVIDRATRGSNQVTSGFLTTRYALRDRGSGARIDNISTADLTGIVRWGGHQMPTKTSKVVI